jgi:hypothetical protein
MKKTFAFLIAAFSVFCFSDKAWSMFYMPTTNAIQDVTLADGYWGERIPDDNFVPQFVTVGSWRFGDLGSGDAVWENYYGLLQFDISSITSFNSLALRLYGTNNNDPNANPNVNIYAVKFNNWDENSKISFPESNSIYSENLGSLYNRGSNIFESDPIVYNFADYIQDGKISLLITPEISGIDLPFADSTGTSFGFLSKDYKTFLSQVQYDYLFGNDQLRQDFIDIQNSSTDYSPSLVFNTFSFNTGETPDSPILPTIYVNEEGKANLSFDLSNLVPNKITFIDPEIAIGYDYIINSGPNFASVLLPTGIGDNIFDLWLWDDTLQQFISANQVLTGGIEFSFDIDGVDRFSIRGIELSANLDPSNTTAFVTGLTFVDTGNVQMQQIPITENVPTPEPSSMILGLISLVGAMGLRKKISI